MVVGFAVAVVVVVGWRWRSARAKRGSSSCVLWADSERRYSSGVSPPLKRGSFTRSLGDDDDEGASSGIVCVVLVEVVELRA